MGLDFGGVKNDLFEHSKEYSQGTGKQRKAAASVVVALDGTGDFEDIQEALNSLGENGGSVFIKEGTYSAKTDITIKCNNVVIQGTGKGTKIVAVGANRWNIDTHGFDNILIRDLYLVGIEDYSDVYSWGIFIDDNSVNVTVENCYIEKCRIGIQDKGSGVIISQNFLTANLHGIYLQPASSIYTIVQNNISNSNTGAANSIGIIIATTYAVVKGNICNSNTLTGINASGDYNTIVGNICNSNTYGIAVDGDNNLMIGNICRSNSTGQITDVGANNLPNGATGTTNLALDDLNIIA